MDVETPDRDEEIVDGPDQRRPEPAASIPSRPIRAEGLPRFSDGDTVAIALVMVGAIVGIALAVILVVTLLG